MTNIFEFQHPESADHLWVETLLFPVVVREPSIYALVYFNIRPVLGVMWNQVMISDSLTNSRGELAHYNENHFLPAPSSLLDIDSALGVRVSATDPYREFDIKYVSPDREVEIDVKWRGSMEPFDIKNPDHSPQAVARTADMHTDVGAAGYDRGGHIDMTGHVVGRMVLNGQEYEVDSVERMDHSWGPRDPMKVPNMFIVSATFEDGPAYHMICPWDPAAGPTGKIDLSHGYVLEDGAVYGLLSDAHIEAEHDGMICTRLHMQVRDVRGREHVLTATPGIGAPWVAGPNAVTHNALMRWSDGKRHDGYGVVMKNHSLTYLIENRAPQGGLIPSKVTV